MKPIHYCNISASFYGVFSPQCSCFWGVEAGAHCISNYRMTVQMTLCLSMSAATLDHHQCSRDHLPVQDISGITVKSAFINNTLLL